MAGGEVKLISYAKLFCINKEFIFFDILILCGLLAKKMLTSAYLN